MLWPQLLDRRRKVAPIGHVARRTVVIVKILSHLGLPTRIQHEVLTTDCTVLRHLDFHPTKPWMYVSIETQNKMYTYKMGAGRINPEIAFRAETLAEPTNRRSRQAAGTVHVHPNGRFLYGANRGQDTVEFQGKKVFKGGENSIVVYSIDQSTGEPSPIQHIETRAIHPRTFHIDPSLRMLVAQHNLPVDVRDGDAVRTIPAGLSVLRIGDDGKLTFVRKYDIDVGGKTMFWMGMVQL